MKKWFYTRDGQNVGPVEPKEIAHLVIEGVLDLDSYVMDADHMLWKHVSDVPGIMDVIHTPQASIVYNEYAESGLQAFLDGKTIPHNVYFHVPVKRLVLMTVLTMGIYELYWWYRQWQYWAQKRKQGYRSFDREFGWFTAELMIMEKIQYDEELNRVERANFSGRVIFWGWVLTGVGVGLLWDIFMTKESSMLSLFMNPVYYAVGFVFGVLYIIPVQRYINRVNEKLGNQVEAPGFGHYVCLVGGILSWLFEFAWLFSVLHH